MAEGLAEQHRWPDKSQYPPVGWMAPHTEGSKWELGWRDGRRAVLRSGRDRARPSRAKLPDRWTWGQTLGRQRRPLQCAASAKLSTFGFRAYW